MDSYIFYGITVVLLIFSFAKDKEKSIAALKKGWRAFENILPEFFVVLLLIGVMLAVSSPQMISSILGKESGWIGVLLASLVGSVTLIPSFVAFPTALLLLEAGAGYMQIGALISTLMMVGLVTMPIEIKYFGKRMTILRNVFAFIFSFFVAFAIGKVVG